MKKTRPRTARDTLASSNHLLTSGLLDFVQEIFREQLAEDQRLAEALKQELLILPSSRLRIHTHRDGQVYFGKLTAQGREIGISGDTDEIGQLSRRAFLEETIPIIETRVERLTKALDSPKLQRLFQKRQERLERYAGFDLDLCRIVFTKEQNEWIDQPYSPNPYYPENLKYQTNSGVWMRSKSEVSLGNTLEALGIPYRYEDIVRIQNPHTGNSPSRDSYYADFKFPNFFAGINVHEHLGAFHLDNYAVNAFKRLNDYHSFPIVALPNRSVRHCEITWSFEHDLQNRESLKNLFRRLLFPSFYG